MLLHTTWYGTYVLEKRKGSYEVIWKERAEGSAEVIAAELNAVALGEVLDRERRGVEKGVDEVLEKRLLAIAPGAEVVDPFPVPVPTQREEGFEMSLLVEANIVRSKEASAGSVDANIMSGIGALSEIDAGLNTAIERLREWYSKIWPEVQDLVEEVGFLGALSRDPEPSSVLAFMREKEPELAKKIHGDLPETGEGAAPDGIGILARNALQLMASREDMERYITDEMEGVAPNLACITGPLVGARLIHSAGGLMRLARLPSSTVQVLGAEKAFFRFLKEGGRPPKHGVLFQHPHVHSMPHELRGRVARTMAASAAIAARMDAYGGDGIDDIREKMEKNLERIRASKKSREGRKGGFQKPFREGWWSDKGGHPDRSRRKKRGKNPLLYAK